MRRGTNSLEVKKLNRNRVFRFVNGKSETSMPDISAALDISGPTVLTIIKELKAAGVVEEVGELKSTGGRKAKAIASVKEARYAVGMDITENHVGFAYTDLSMKVLKHERIRKPFYNEGQYFSEIGELLEDFIDRNLIPKERIEGVGMALPGIYLLIHTSLVFMMHRKGCGQNTYHIPANCSMTPMLRLSQRICAEGGRIAIWRTCR